MITSWRSIILSYSGSLIGSGTPTGSAANTSRQKTPSQALAGSRGTNKNTPQNVMANIGFIGLGIMGAPMALNLHKGGHQLFLHSRSGVKEKTLLARGAKECNSPADVAEA